MDVVEWNSSPHGSAFSHLLFPAFCLSLGIRVLKWNGFGSGPYPAMEGPTPALNTDQRWHIRLDRNPQGLPLLGVWQWDAFAVPLHILQLPEEALAQGMFKPHRLLWDMKNQEDPPFSHLKSLSQ